MWNSSAGNFSLENGTAHSLVAARQLGVSVAFAPVGDNKKTVRPIDANELILTLVNMEGKCLDDDTISECIKAVKETPTIKRHFGKWIKRREE